MKVAIEAVALLTVTVFPSLVTSADRQHQPQPAGGSPNGPHNVVLFVADGLRHDAVTVEDAPTIYRLRQEGVDFVNSHSHFPTVTTANASALATGHGLGDTGDFTNGLFDDPKEEKGEHNGRNCSKDSRPLTFGMENNLDLAQLNCLRGGDYLGIPETLISIARKEKYHTAVVGKLGPTAIQAILDVELEIGSDRETTLIALKKPETVIIDSGTGKPNGFPIPDPFREEMIKTHLGVVAPDPSKPGTPNVAQQKYFTDVVVRAILPVFKDEQRDEQKNGKEKKPFLLIFWSGDPDGTQHSQVDSLGKLEPGINGPSSKEAIHNADHNLSEILEALKKYGLWDDTDVMVTADHGFSTISKGFLDAGGVSRVHSYAAGTVTEPEIARGLLPPGFLAIDLAHALQKDDQLYDVNSGTVPALQTYPAYQYTDKSGKYIEKSKAENSHNGSRAESPSPINSGGAGKASLPPPAEVFPTYKRVELKGDRDRYPTGVVLIGGTGKATYAGDTDAEIIVEPSGNSVLLYLPQKDEAKNKDLASHICDFLTQQDYVDGVFVRVAFGTYPGTLTLEDVGLDQGSAKLTKPAIVVNLKGFPLDPKRPWYTWVQIAEGLQQGQGMHGGLNRADTFNNIVAHGPDFRKEFTDPWPVSNADLAQTIARILHFDKSDLNRPNPPPSDPPKWQGRVLWEALNRDALAKPAPNGLEPDSVEYSSGVKYSEPTDKGFRTVLHFQRLVERDQTKDRPYDYYDQACLVAAFDRNDARCKYSDHTGLGNGRAAEISRESKRVERDFQHLEEQACKIHDSALREASLYALTETQVKPEPGKKKKDEKCWATKEDGEELVRSDPGCIQHRANLTDEKKAEIIDQLKQEGLVRPEDGDAFPGGLIGGIFPPVRWDGGKCPQLPQSFRTAPGSAFGKHHSYPGGLVVHETTNEDSAVDSARRYRNRYESDPATPGEALSSAADQLRHDILIAAPIWHDWAKTIVFQWNVDGTEFPELQFGGNGKTDKQGDPGDSRTGAHHIIGLAETMKRGLSPQFVVAQAFAHHHGDPSDEFQEVNWIRAAAILAQIDPVARGYVSRGLDGKLHLPTNSSFSGTTVERIPHVEFFLHNLSDADHAYADPAVAFSEDVLQLLAPEFGCDNRSDYNNQFRNPALSNLTAEEILQAYRDAQEKKSGDKQPDLITDIGGLTAIRNKLCQYKAQVHCSNQEKANDPCPVKEKGIAIPHGHSEP